METKEYLKTAAKRAFERIKTGEDTTLDVAARFFSEELDKNSGESDQRDLRDLASEMLEALEAGDEAAADDLWVSVCANKPEDVAAARERNADFYREHLVPILAETLASMTEGEREQILAQESDWQMEELLKRSRRAQIAMFGV